MAWVIVTAVFALALLLGYGASPLLLVLLAVAIGGVVLLRTPQLGLPLLVAAALLVPLEIGTGTEVSLNLATLLVPLLLGAWALSLLLDRNASVATSSVQLPLLLFLVTGLLSLIIGVATWDTAVPRSNSFWLVQLAQWGIFAFSAGAFLLTANLSTDVKWLRWLTFAFIVLAGGVAIGRLLPGVSTLLRSVQTIAFSRAPLWMLLTAVAGGQLLFNRSLSLVWRLFLLAVLGATAVYALFEQQEAISNLAGIGAVVGMLVWLRWPKLRWPILLGMLLLMLTGALWPAIWQAAGGEDEWLVSGGSRLALIGRVVEDTMRNPITGLGPAAYRAYGAVRPLVYRHIVWTQPRISSHNNYVDLFSHVGIIGLVLFAWFCVEFGRLGFRLRGRVSDGFELAYVNGMLAAGAGALVLMLFADWILPFVYNIGFPGFQASVLVWLFLGGLVALDRLLPDDAPSVEPTAVD